MPMFIYLSRVHWQYPAIMGSGLDLGIVISIQIVDVISFSKSSLLLYVIELDTIRPVLDSFVVWAILVVSIV